MASKDCSTAQKFAFSITDFESHLIEVKDKFQNLGPDEKIEAFLLIQDLQFSLSCQVNNSQETSNMNEENLTFKNSNINITCSSSEVKESQIIRNEINKEISVSNSQTVSKDITILALDKSTASQNSNKRISKSTCNSRLFCPGSKICKQKSHSNKSFCEFCGTQFKLNNKMSIKLKESSSVKSETPDNSVSNFFCHNLLCKNKLKINRMEDSSELNPSQTRLQKFNPKVKKKLLSKKKIGVKYECTTCSKQFFQRQQYDKHILIVKHYKCAQCKLMFSRNELKKHKQKFHGTLPESRKNNVCEMCNKKFFNASLLISHQKIHLNQQSICNQHFSTAETLQNKVISTYHKNKKGKEMNKEKRFSCTVCNSKFVYKQGLERHIYQRHTETDPYKCQSCDYECRSKANLKRHADLHLNDRRFVCEICGTAFNAHSTLKSHIAYVHSEERRFNCQACGKSFKLLSALNRHLRIHEEERPYVCYCKESYKRMSHLKRHIYSVHKQKFKSNQHNKISKNLTKSVCSDISITDIKTTLVFKKKSPQAQKEEASLKSFSRSDINTGILSSSNHLDKVQQSQIEKLNTSSVLENIDKHNVNILSNLDCQLVTNDLPILIQESLNMPEAEICLTAQERLLSHSVPFQMVTTEGTLLTVQYETLQTDHQMIVSDEVNQNSEVSLPEPVTSIWDPNLLINRETTVIRGDQSNMHLHKLTDDLTGVSSIPTLKNTELPFVQVSTMPLRSVTSDTFNPDSNDLPCSDLQPLSDQFYCESVTLNTLLSV